jgi:hypothetical protein
MKSIIDILDEMESSTPANTLGMGNPTPATETTPGSEPVCPTCKKDKKKKKQVKESVFDDNFEETIEDSIIEDWIKNNTTCKIYKIDPKTKEISCGYMNVAGPIPDYIKLGKILSFRMRIDGGEDIVNVKLPTKSDNITLEFYDMDKVRLDGEGSQIKTLYIMGDPTYLDLGKKLNITKLDISQCSRLTSVDGLKGIKVENLNLPRLLCGSILRGLLKLSVTADIYMNGNIMQN